MDRNLRAWLICLMLGMVALRKESVDRNYAKETPPHITQRSLSARRAWIEILFHAACFAFDAVALRKESVDRNNNTSKKKKINPGRSPQGERG